MKNLFRQTSSAHKAKLAAGSVALMALVGVAALAGGGGQSQFGSLASQLQSWAQGSLGIVIAIAALLVGLSIGVVKQSLMAVVTGIGIAIALYYGPTVISGVLNASGALHMLPAMASSVAVF